MKLSLHKTFSITSVGSLLIGLLVMTALAGSQSAQAAGGSITLTTANDFLGTSSSCLSTATIGARVQITEDGTSPTDPDRGEIALQATTEDYFRTGTAPDTALWDTGSYGATPATFAVSGGQASITSVAGVGGGYIQSKTSPSTRHGYLEGVVTFSAGAAQHFGWASPAFDSFEYAIFSTGFTTDTLYVRTNNSGGLEGEISTAVGPLPTGPVRLGIEWIDNGDGTAEFRYYVNGTRVAATDNHTITDLPADTRITLSNNTSASSETLSADWIRYTPYATQATANQSTSYFSCTLDGGSAGVYWNSADWTADVPTNTTVTVAMHSKANLGDSWPGTWTTLTNGVALPSGLAGRYVEFRVQFTSTDSSVTPKLQSITLNYSELAVLPTLSINDVSLSEGNSGTTNATFRISLSATSTDPVSVSYATANGSAPSAAAGSDYTATSGTAIIPAGQGYVDITVPILGDTTYEQDEHFTVTLSIPTNATIADAQGIGTILNDDTLPALSVADVSTTEGNSGQKDLTFTVSLTNPSYQDITVHYATADGTATSGSDYVATSGDLTFTAGQTSKTVTVSVLGDTLNEANETFTLILSSPSNATISQATATGTITNDDALPSLSIASASTAEGDSGQKDLSFVVTLTGDTAQTVTVNYTTVNGTATAGSDYVAASGTLTFAPGETSKSIVVKLNGDTLNEANETFTLTLSSPSNATISQTTATGTITNDDALPSLAIASASTAEGNSGQKDLSFVVTLTGDTAQTVTVHYTTVNGTATAGSDYVAASGTLTFAPGETSKSIVVKLNGDTAIEPDETFTLTLSSPSNATISQATATGTIVNDDETPVDPMPYKRFIPIVVK